MRLGPLTIVLLVLGAVRAEATAPQLYAPAIAVFHNQDTSIDNPDNYILVSISGANFGSPTSGNFQKTSCGLSAGGSFVLIRQNNAVQLTAGSTDGTRIYSWAPTQVVVKIHTGVANKDHLNVEVCTPGGATGTGTLVKYSYVHNDVPAGGSGGSGVPLALARASDGSLWIDEEVHTRLKTLSASSVWSAPLIPQVSGSGIFASISAYPPGPTRTSLSGEDIIVDTLGRVWFTEAGNFPHGPQCIGGSNAGAGCIVASQCPSGTCSLVPNRSRIVMYNPSTSQFSAYNVPGDNQQVIGLTWDPTTERIWFTEAVRSQVFFTQAQGARLTSFAPANITPDNTFGFTTSETCTIPSGQYVGTCSTTTTRACYTTSDCVLADQVCAPGASSDANCYHEYEIPSTNGQVAFPGHVLRHSDGAIWYGAYWGGNHLGRLNPSTGAFQQFPLPGPIDAASCSALTCACNLSDPECARCCGYLLLGSGPWSVVEASNQDIVLSYQNQPAVGRFSYALWQSYQCDGAHATDCACLSLDGNGQNPCLTNTFDSTFDPTFEYPHSAAIDGQGQVWLSHFQGSQLTNCSLSTSLSLLPTGGSHLVNFPPLGFYTGGTCVAPSTTGMVLDPSTGAMWFNEYYRKRLSKMTPIS